MRDRGPKAVAVGRAPRAPDRGRPRRTRAEAEAAVDVIEFLGNEELIHAQSAGHDIVAIVDTDTGLEVGETVMLTAPPRRLHLFDPSSGLSLAEGRTAG